MTREIPERDWRYLRSIQEEMLEELSRRINAEVAGVLASSKLSQAEKRRKIYEIVHDRDQIVAECFDDWRRSRAYERCWALRAHGLLLPVHIAQLTPESQFAVMPFEEKPKKPNQTPEPTAPSGRGSS